MRIVRINGWMRWCAGACVLAITAACLGVAWAAPAGESYAFSAKGKVVSPERFTVLAPMGGQVRDFDWEPGDAVAAEDLAIELTPTQIFAACDGVVRGLHAVQGDQAGQVVAQYGALCSLERDDIRHVQASTASAYNKAENRDVRVGDVLRVRQGSGDNEVTGAGTVIRTEQGGFLLEMRQGDFDLEETATLYKGTGDSYPERDKVGKGKVARPPILQVLGDGVVAEVLVTEGQRVVRGQPIFTLDAASARHAEPPSSQAVFGKSGVVGEVSVRPGQFVVQGQALMTVSATEALEAVLDVDELDIAKVSVGQRVRVTVDAYPSQEWIGTVREIVLQGTEVLDTTKFHVKVNFDSSAGLMMGMHVTGYWD